MIPTLPLHSYTSIIKFSRLGLYILKLVVVLTYCIRSGLSGCKWTRLVRERRIVKWSDFMVPTQNMYTPSYILI